VLVHCVKDSQKEPTSCSCHAAMDNSLLVMGGRTSEVGWFRSRTETYHNDVVSVDFSVGPQWRPQLAQGDIPQSREFHTISAISGGRLLLLGGVVAPSKEMLETSRVILGQGHAICVILFTMCRSPQSAFHRASIEALVHAALLLHAVLSCCRGP